MIERRECGNNSWGGTSSLGTDVLEIEYFDVLLVGGGAKNNATPLPSGLSMRVLS